MSTHCTVDFFGVNEVSTYIVIRTRMLSVCHGPALSRDFCFCTSLALNYIIAKLLHAYALTACV